MLNQKLDFSFSEPFIYNKNCFPPFFTSFNSTVVFFRESNYCELDGVDLNSNCRDYDVRKNSVVFGRLSYTNNVLSSRVNQ